MAATTSVFLNVHDIDKSLEFYKSLGFRVVNAWKGDDGKVTYADLELDGAEFGLGSIPSSDDPAFREWVATPLGAGVVVYFTVPNVEKVLARAESVKATIEVPLQERSYGRVFTLNDLDGYTITFLTEPRRGRSRKAAKKAGARKGAKASKKAAKAPKAPKRAKAAKGAARRGRRGGR